MDFSDDDLRDFKLEAIELLEGAEKSLLAMDAGGDFKGNYDAIFRAFHSIKGAAGMLALGDLQSHMHQLEDILTGQQSQGSIPKIYIDFFLKGSDAALKILGGAKVSFDYQVSCEAASIAEKVEGETAVVTNRPKVGRIFLLDDESEIIEALTSLLTGMGYEVQGTSRGSDALGRIVAFNPHVILTDIAMPEMTGPQFLSAVRPLLPDVPVVFVSGFVNKEVLMQTLQHDVFAVVEKPFDVSQIAAICERAIKTPRPIQLLGRSIKTLVSKFSDLDDYLKARGKDEERQALQKEVIGLLEGFGKLQKQSEDKAA